MLQFELIDLSIEQLHPITSELAQHFVTQAQNVAWEPNLQQFQRRHVYTI